MASYLIDKSFQKELGKHQFKTKFKMIIKRAGKVAQQVKVFATNPEDLCLSPKNHMVKDKTPTGCPLASTHVSWCI